MKSIKEVYKIGIGPSSSHTMGPVKGAKLIKEKHPDCSFSVTLYGSLALTGVGHGTDRALLECLGSETTMVYDVKNNDIPHPNTMDIIVLNNGVEIAKYRLISIGGGDIVIEGFDQIVPKEIYPHSTFAEISEYCEYKEIELYEYAFMHDEDLYDYLELVWDTMKKSIKEGLRAMGVLPGGLNVHRKARFLYSQKHIDETPETKESRIVCSYAYAVAEQNASGGTIVTAPTCGSCGVVPSVLYYMQKKHKFSDDDIIKALATAGIIGNLIKTNASISGAECGCQAEIGSATSMASAGLSQLFSMNIDQIEYASEIAMEHQLGLTCDPIGGLVQIPCIERNAVAAMRAISCLNLANFLTNTRQISFDSVVETMYQTGKDMNCAYRETSEGGLAKSYKLAKNIAHLR